MPFHLTRDGSMTELPADSMERANAAQAVIGRPCPMKNGTHRLLFRETAYYRKS
jgi:hypothetical protein